MVLYLWLILRNVCKNMLKKENGEFGERVRINANENEMCPS